MARTAPVPPPAVAAFDLDGTLTRGGSVVHWLTAVAGASRVRRALAQHAAALATGAVRSGAAADVAKEALFTSVLAGRPLEDAAAVSAAFAEAHLRHAVRPEVVARLAEHLDRGHLVVVVSASPSLYVARIAELLGAHGAAATDLEVGKDGALTGRYDGENCRGEAKLRKVTALLGTLGAAEARPRYAYGNSRGDLQLLEAADRPVDVSRLGPFGRLRRFPRLRAVPIG
ncbi:MAG TPA: HAD-IB family hydrolase [Acidimicrobiales bacterium]|jgi:phosphatidylglycerophosphatase C|nr:HAD-IB family hydrolase [Acidimicrobiales bacterium]